MTIQDVYTQYQIMPQLQTHMLRVAGIAKLITDNWEDRKIAGKCVAACLLHDMGNLAKFKLSPELEREWGQRQREFWGRYGHDAHEATYAILRELRLEEYVDYLQGEATMYGIQPTVQDFRMIPLPSLIVLYADLRVSMAGVVSMEARIADLQARYGGEYSAMGWVRELEAYVQTLTQINVQQIIEADVVPLFDGLLGYNVE